jgi:hypothetical protein
MAGDLSHERETGASRGIVSRSRLVAGITFTDPLRADVRTAKAGLAKSSLCQRCRRM